MSGNALGIPPQVTPKAKHILMMPKCVCTRSTNWGNLWRLSAQNKDIGIGLTELYLEKTIVITIRLATVKWVVQPNGNGSPQLIENGTYITNTSNTKLLVASCGQLQFCDAPDLYRTRHVWSQVSGSASGKQRRASAAVKRTSSSLSSRAITTNISKSVPSAPFQGTCHEPLHNTLLRNKG